MSILNQENTIKLSSLIHRYPHKKALTIPMLWLFQEQDGYISEDAMEYISSFLELPYMHIYSVATFYTMFRLQKSDKRVLEICRTLSCELNGSMEIKEYLQKNYSERFEIVEVECMGACSGAPMCTLDGKYLENLTLQMIDEVLHES